MSVTKEINEFFKLGLEFAEDSNEEQNLKLVKDEILKKEYLTKEDAKKDKDLSKHFYNENRITFKVLLEKQFGVDLKDIEGANDAVKIIKDKVDADIVALKEGQGEPSKEVEAIQKKYDEAVKELSLSKEGLSTLKTQLEQKETEFTTTQKNWVKDQKLKQLWDSPEIKISETKDEFWLKGFKSELTSKYKFDLDENNEAIVTDKDGNLIQSTANVGAKQTPLEVIVAELEAAGGLRKNNVDPNKPNVTVQPSVGSEAGQNVRPSHPNAH